MYMGDRMFVDPVKAWCMGLGAERLASMSAEEFISGIVGVQRRHGLE